MSEESIKKNEEETGSEVTESEQKEPHHPRAFSTATGLMFQVVGSFMLFGGCCIWSMGTHLFSKTPVEASSVAEHISKGHWSHVVGAIWVIATFFYGMALFGVGLGLQNEKRKSAGHALWLTMIMIITYLGALVTVIVNEGISMLALMPLIFTLVSTLLFLFAGNSYSEMKKNPPELDMNTVTEEELEEIMAKKRQKRYG